MKEETKDLLISMVETWNKFNPHGCVEAHFDDNEFTPEHWSLDIAIGGVISSEFVSFLLPAIIAQDCHWFLFAYGSDVIFHIQ